MSRYLRVTMPDGSKWDVPTIFIAANRAKYYAEKDQDTTYEEEFTFTLHDDFELQDWAANNMNWDDVKSHAVEVKLPVEVDYQEGWVNGKKEIIEK